MKELIRNNVFGFLLMAGFTLVATSCQKDKNESPAATNDAGNINTSVVMPELCSPIPDSLQPPAGNNLFLQTFARGVQIYEGQRNPANPSELVWVNIAPLASLYTNSNFTNLIINHFAGPSWQFIKGDFKDEKVVAKKLKGSTQDRTAIQWLLLQAIDSLSTPHNPVSFVQRICTQGGLASITSPTFVGQLDSIPYTASYLFYTKN
jgi:uncharacterized protein DUF3455